MRKKNGFTLVELLAVIVVLALILIIAIPSVMDAIGRAKKESFYIFTQSLNNKATNKYIQDSDIDPEMSSCAVYDIAKDLDITDIDHYEGWVKVEKKPANSGYNSVSIDIEAPTPLQAVKYCIIKGSECVPNTTYRIEEGATKTTVTKKIKEGQSLCVNYQYPEGNALKTGARKCKSYSEGINSSDTYEFKVEVTLTDKAYVLQDYPLVGEEKIKKSDFYKKLDYNKKNPPLEDAKNPTKISSPRCSTEDAITYKGITDTKTTLVTTTRTTKKVCDPTTTVKKEYYIKFNTYGGIKVKPIKICDPSDNNCDPSDINDPSYNNNDIIPIPEREGYTFGGWFYDTSFTKPIEGVYVHNIKEDKKYDLGGCLIGYKDINLYAKWNSNETTTTTKGVQIVDPKSTTTRESVEITTSTTKERETSTVTTTTTNRDKTDYSLLLKSLTVSGYDIGFDSLVYNYNLNVPNNQTNLSVNYEAMQPENVEVTVIGNENLNVGVNNISVEVFNIYTGKRLVYKIYVKRFDVNEHYDPYPTRPIESPSGEVGAPDPSLEESNAQLKMLMVSGYVFKFDPQIYEYDLEIRNEDKLDVSYKPASKNAVVVVSGDENIKDGSVIEVYVQSENGYYTKTYKINLKRNIPESNSTKVLKTVAIGLGAVLVILLIITAINKKKGSRIVKKDTNQPYTSTTMGEN